MDLIRRADLGPVILVAHSVSAMIGVLAYLRDPTQFRGLAMIGPSPCYLNDGDYQGGYSRADIDGLLASLDANHRTWATHLAPVIMGNLDQPALAEELQTSFCRMDPVAARGFAKARGPPRRVAEQETAAGHRHAAADLAHQGGRRGGSGHRRTLLPPDLPAA